MAEFAEAEEFILTVCANGYGKRSSAYEYRRTNRGGQGITNIDNLDRNGPVVASFPAHNGEQLMLVTDQAKLIRMSVGDTRVDRPQQRRRPPVQRRRGRACRLRRPDRRGGGAGERGRGADRRGAGERRRRPRPGRRSTTAPATDSAPTARTRTSRLRRRGRPPPSPASPPRAAACGGSAPGRARSRARPRASPRRARSSAPPRRRPPGVSSCSA